MTTAEINNLNACAAHTTTSRQWSLAQCRTRDAFREFAGQVALHRVVLPHDDANNRAWTVLTRDRAVVAWAMENGWDSGVDASDALVVLARAACVRDGEVS